MDTPPSPPPDVPARPWLRPLLLIGALAAVAVGLKLAGVEIDKESVVGWVHASGPWGLVVFVLLVVGTNVAQVPAWIFVVAAGTVWPLWQAWLVSYAACMVAATFTFEVFGRAGGQALRTMERPWVKKVLSTIDAHPIRGVALLRAAFMITPPITVALALAGVRRRDHLVGTAVGVLVPLTFILALADQLMD